MSDEIVKQDEDDVPGMRLYTAMFSGGDMFAYHQFTDFSLNQAVFTAEQYIRNKLHLPNVVLVGIRIRLFDSTDIGNHKEVIDALEILISAEMSNAVQRFDSLWRIVGKYNNAPKYDSQSKR